jgi:general secretion pathway protein D
VNASRIPRVLVLLWISVLALTASGAGRPAADAPAADAQVPMIALNFADTVDVRVLAKWVSEVTGQTFAYDDSFQGTVMLEAPKEIPQSSLMPLFESILKLKGFAMVRREDVVMIVKGAAAPALDTGVVLPDQQSAAQGTDFVNQIVTLKHADANTVAGAVGPFLSNPQAVRVLPEQNKLSISDYAENVRRALEIIAHLDQQEVRPQVVLCPLEFARAADVVKQLDAAFTKARAAKGPGAGLPIFNADARTNAVVIVTREEDVAAIRDILAALDVQANEPERPVHIYRLQNTQAEKIMPILDELLKGYQEKAAAGEQGTRAAAGVQESSGGGTRGQRGSDIQIVGDTENNALIVVATREDQQWVGELIIQLDQRRAQVLLEVWLVVVNESGEKELGVELEALGHAGKGTVSAGTFFGLSDFDKTTGARTLPVPPLGGATLAIIDPGSLNAILNALETHDNGRVISRPRLLANANEEATFESTRQEPFTTISAITASTSTTSFGGYQKAGTTLAIKPTVLAGDYVYLDIKLSLSSFLGTSSDPAVPPPIDQNEISTGVAVPDQATIVIGGIVRDEDSVSVSKVPILGDIPLLGLLFRSTSKSTTHSTLYAFIRPRIFRAADFSDLKQASEPSWNEAEKVQNVPSAVPGMSQHDP